MSKLQIVSLVWLVLAAIAFFGMIYSFPPIIILLVAWTGGVVSYALAREVFPDKFS